MPAGRSYATAVIRWLAAVALLVISASGSPRAGMRVAPQEQLKLNDTESVTETREMGKNYPPMTPTWEGNWFHNAPMQIAWLWHVEMCVTYVSKDKHLALYPCVPGQLNQTFQYRHTGVAGFHQIFFNITAHAIEANGSNPTLAPAAGNQTPGALNYGRFVQDPNASNATGAGAPSPTPPATAGSNTTGTGASNASNTTTTTANTSSPTDTVSNFVNITENQTANQSNVAGDPDLECMHLLDGLVKMGNCTEEPAKQWGFSHATDQIFAEAAMPHVLEGTDVNGKPQNVLVEGCLSVMSGSVLDENLKHVDWYCDGTDVLIKPCKRGEIQQKFEIINVDEFKKDPDILKSRALAKGCASQFRTSLNASNVSSPAAPAAPPAAAPPAPAPAAPASLGGSKSFSVSRSQGATAKGTSQAREASTRTAASESRVPHKKQEINHRKPLQRKENSAPTLQREALGADSSKSFQTPHAKEPDMQDSPPPARATRTVSCPPCPSTSLLDSQGLINREASHHPGGKFTAEVDSGGATMRRAIAEANAEAVKAATPSQVGLSAHVAANGKDCACP